jgi:serine/threonine protein kinase
MNDGDRRPRALVGTTLDGAYKLKRLLGEGGMGAVYEAVQLRLEKRVAVKVMAGELAASAEALARFRREVQVTSQLAHPHIVHVSDFGAAPGGQPYLVMEYLEGEDLADRLNRVGRLPIETAQAIVTQVASALSATHAKGIVHRDLKPENVFLLRLEGVSDFVKVVDFGISKVKHSDEKLTRASVMMGTPAYMAPEQATGRVDDIDHRTDQWALACLAWEMLTGDEPFVGKDTPTVLYSIVHGEPSALLAPNVPAGVEAVLRRALSKRQGDRFPTIGAFARAFAAAATATPVAARTPTPLVLPAAVRTPPPLRTPAAVARTVMKTGWAFPWRRKRKRGQAGIVGLTMALGRKALEDLLPAPKQRPLRVVAWISAVAIGVALSAAAVFYFRPRPATTVVPPPSSVVKPADVARPPAHKPRHH